MVALPKNVKIPRFIQRMSLRRKIALSVLFVVVVSYVLIFTIPRQVTYAYAGQTCVKQLSFLPVYMDQRGSSDFAISFQDSVSLGETPIIAMKSCFTATKAPTVGANGVRTSLLGGLFGIQHYNVVVAEAPKAQTTDLIGKTLPLTRPAEISLDKNDTVFTYKVASNGKETTCDHAENAGDDGHGGTKLQCPLGTLGLEQGKDYQAKLERYFASTKVATLAEGKITTLKALALVNASVTEAQIVYDVPTSFTFEYDKPLTSAAAELTSGTGASLKIIDAKTTTDGTRVVVTPTEPLARNTAFSLTVKSAISTDGSSLPDQYTTNFTMSGGPKVTGVSVGTISAPLSGTTVLTFDQDIANVSQISKLVSVEGLAARVVKSGTTLKITYSGAAKCTDYTITIKKGLTSSAGVTQDDDWTFAGRTICYTTQTIGTSQKGRPITAYIFGSGGKTILYTGAIHGNEQSARLLMNAWINELEANPQNIPAGVQIVVIPAVNPDGVAANTRTNANNVDLNRNFKVSDWTSNIQTVNGEAFPGGGGASAESEPETRALVAYTRALSPTLTMSYHGSAGYVIANTCGASPNLAASYASMVGYRNMTGVSDAFAYQITGTYDDWICESLGRASVLVELTTNVASEFGRHKAALWAMAKS